MSRKKDQTRLYFREFLNSPGHHMGAYVLLSVEDSSGKPADRTWSDISCVIADCNEQINLVFPLTDPSDRKNSVRKAKMLARAFHAFSEAVQAEAEVVAAREKERNRIEHALRKKYPGIDRHELRAKIKAEGEDLLRRP